LIFADEDIKLFWLVLVSPAKWIKIVKKQNHYALPSR